MKYFLFCLWLILQTGLTAREIPLAEKPYDIGRDFFASGFQNQTGADFVKKHRANYFRFLEKGKETSANAIRQGNVKFFGIEVFETRIWFEGESNTVSRLELSLYNSGDAEGNLNAQELENLLEEVRKNLTPEGREHPKAESVNHDNGVLQKTQIWRNADTAAQLVWRYRKMDRRNIKTDFVRLTLLPAENGKETAGNQLAKRSNVKARSSIVQNVRKVTDEDESTDVPVKIGDVYIANVPMVDQGSKGYCAVATSERVLRYFGNDIDEHELGAATGTTADGGTSSREMMKTIDKIGKKCKLGYRVIFAGTKTIMSLEKQVEDYNKAAKKLKKPEITQDQYIRREGNTIIYNAPAAMRAMDIEVLRAMKKKQSGYKPFRKGIRDQVKAGIPLFWGVMLGQIPEPEIPQASGGHMRLIIGFNDSTNEILYTDSWGAGHELKRMKEEDAWVITTSLSYLRPRK